MRMLFVVKSVCFIGTVNTVLTSSSNTVTLEAGYYDSVTISTDISKIVGTITYTHHQCSNSEVNATYNDSSIGKTGASAVNETTINGQTVSTTQGGCYTTPYYKYTYSTKEEKDYVSSVTRPSYNPISGGWNMVTFTYDKDGNQTGATTLYACNEYDQSTTVVGKYTVNVTKTSYGTTTIAGSKVEGTWYLKTCGHTNGELLSVTITY